MDIFKREGYILAAATGILYLMAYFSILARADVYGVPIGMMSFDLFQLTRAALNILLCIFVIATISIVMYGLIVKSSWKITLLYFLLFIILLPMLCFYTLKSESRTGAFIYSAIFLTLSVFLFFVGQKIRRDKYNPGFF